MNQSARRILSALRFKESRDHAIERKESKGEKRRDSAADVRAPAPDIVSLPSLSRPSFNYGSEFMKCKRKLNQCSPELESLPFSLLSCLNSERMAFSQASIATEKGLDVKSGT
jgi:hypothetical protein